MRLCLVAALSLAGPAVAADPPTVAELFPLSVGRSWTYRVLTGPGPGEREKFVVRVTGEEMVGTTTCFRLEGWVGDRLVAAECVGLSADGVSRFKIEKEEVTPPVPFLKPLKPSGKTNWSSRSYKIGSRSASATFVAEPAKAEVTVKAGTFKTVVVEGVSRETGSDPRKTTIWYAPGVGIVKQTIEGRQAGEGRPGVPGLALELEEWGTGSK